MATFKWFDGEVPENVKIRQVYGLVFTKDGRMLMRIEDGRHSLAGGTPESYDKDKIETLKRELIEEVNTTIYEPVMVGYQLVDEENGIPPYAQVRMTALIENIGEKKPDPATGKTYDRMLVPYYKGAELLGWGEIGAKQIESAFLVAKERFGFSQISETTIFI